MQALLDAIRHMPHPQEATRIFHGRGGLHPGCEHLSLDAFPPVLLLTSFAELDETSIANIGNALRQRWSQIAANEPLNWVLQIRLVGGQGSTHVMSGSVPDPHVVSEAGTRYAVHVSRGQNHGLFLDMAAGRAWVRRHVEERARQHAGDEFRVLNLFAYTCAFSVVAMQAGATQVINMDMSRGALSIGQHNHRLNDVSKGASFLAHDIFTSWGKITRGGPYALIIVDPPSYQKGSFVATKDYARLLRRLPDLLTPGGHALICLNAPELPASFVHEHMREQAPELEFIERVPNPPVFADRDPERSLKVLVYRRAMVDGAGQPTRASH
ncbi:class I SAM-dependent methyltransferase [Diaphorobacter aerolatus]|uniref:Class I SAM-dependent methyltransferase n=1 Tax=Diaphorobacter aerolatus TaxID=1288495 RepID=A0A7H0GJM0_9BURK|nr:class I SAM-dependent methyltransferase [Diaphorobacter aerolatus]QNP48486.1 class I SAM-dependent methyltransferase [Diaphorobacter aerolatus]